MSELVIRLEQIDAAAFYLRSLLSVCVRKQQSLDNWFWNLPLIRRYTDREMRKWNAREIHMRVTLHALSKERRDLIRNHTTKLKGL